MPTVLIFTNAFLLVTTLFLLHAVLRKNARKRQRGILRAWKIPKVDLAKIDPIFCRDGKGPHHETEVCFLGRGNTSDTESWILAALSKKASRMFEFGTLDGHTAYLWARNSPADAVVVTLTLGPQQHELYKAEKGDAAQAARSALEESRSGGFLYSGTAAEEKIIQLYGDSKDFDESPFAQSCDLIFVDGSHAYSYVKSDSHKALRMIRPGGLILWHDYRGPGEIPGVYKALGELARGLPLVHVAGTTLVAYRHAGGAGFSSGTPAHKSCRETSA